MNKLAITAGMMVIAPCGSQAQAGSPMRWFPPQLTWKGELPAQGKAKAQKKLDRSSTSKGTRDRRPTW